MASTDARTGFRLPWSTDQRQDGNERTAEADSPEGSMAAEGPAIEGVEGSTRHDTALEATTMSEATIDAAAGGETDLTAETGGSSPSGGRRGAPKVPSKFMADLTKAMQAAAESAREEALSRLAAEAKASIEEIHVRSATDSAELRRQTDEDIAGIREWSKAEIARVREETDQKVAGRKSRLETDIEEHGATIERQIERVQARVTAYEAEMAEFFERLLSEQDPSRFASLAENVPEPPSLSAADLAAPPRQAGKASAKSGGTGSSRSQAATDVAVADRGADNDSDAFAAIEAAAQAEDWHDTANGATGPSTEFEGGAFQPESEGEQGTEDDPRLAALAMSQDFATAEAEAAAVRAAGEEIPTIGDDALAARLAGLVPAGAEGSAGAPAEPQATHVVVVGLVSVASIASFKRHLGRLAGVQSVGVSSGPDGEFVFAVHHAPDVVLRDVIPGLPGFQARVTGTAEGTIQVTARDPESEA
jgi:hypothetical protein